MATATLEPPKAATFEADLATEQVCISLDNKTGRGVADAVVMSGFVPPDNAQVPLLDNHSRNSSHDVVGSVRNIRVSSDRLVGTVHFASDEKSLAGKVDDKHLTDLSVGIKPLKTERIEPGTSRNIGGKRFTAPSNRPLFIYVEWTIREVSVTPIGADSRAKFRNDDGDEMQRTAPQLSLREASFERGRAQSTAGPTLSAASPVASSPAPKGTEMFATAPAIQTSKTAVGRIRGDIKTQQARLEQLLGVTPPDEDDPHWNESDRGQSIPDWFHRTAAIHGIERGPTLTDTIIRTRSNPDLSAAFTDAIGSKVVDTFVREPKTWMAIAYEGSTQTFQPSDRVTLGKASNPTILPRGGTAEHLSLESTAETITAARFAQMVEIPLEDGSDDTLNALPRITTEWGIAFNRVIGDAVWAIFLANNNLADGTPLFDTSRNNTTSGGGSILAEAGLEAAEVDVAEQTLNGTSLNLVADILACQPAQWHGAATLLESGGRHAGIRLVVEPRIGSAGFVDPFSGSTVSGDATRWYLIASSLKPIEVAYVGGVSTPHVRSFELGPGEWGFGLDAHLDFGVAAVTPHGCHFAAGA